MLSQKMNDIERRSVFSLSIIMALRLLGLFMVIPIFSLYATNLEHATPKLIGLTMGIYGLTQACFQIPLGTLSDKLGRKKIIAFGLTIFIIGSIIAAMSHTIWGLFLGRALQGVGAVGSSIIALISDLTREEQRTKAMAIAGMTIGASFTLSMALGPLLASIIHVNGIFWLGALLSIVAIIILFKVVPEPTVLTTHSNTSVDTISFFKLLQHKELQRLNIGIFTLHGIFTAGFVVIPLGLKKFAGMNSSDQWLVFLPSLTLAFAIAIPCLLLAEKLHKVKPFFLGGIIMMVVAETILCLFAKTALLYGLSLLLLFAGFSLLEAFLPSLVSRTAPASRKGTALGIYSFAQFFGVFVGGVLGGLLYGSLGIQSVYLFCAILLIAWLTIAFPMKNPQYYSKSNK